MYRLLYLIKNNFKGLVRLAGLLTIVASIVGFVGQALWPFDLAAHFRVQYFVVLAGVACFMIFWGRLKSALACGLIALANLWVVFPFYFPSPGPPGLADTTYRALFLNVLTTNNHLEEVNAFIEEANPDFIVLAEVTPRWKSTIEHLSTNYPHFDCSLVEGFDGIALLSRYPLEQSEIVRLKDNDAPMVVGRVKLKNQSFTLFGVHPFSPVSPRRSRIRNQYLSDLPGYMDKFEGAKMVIGDFNTTPWSKPFTDFLIEADLQNAAHGFGLQPTWPAGISPVKIPIDHCLVSSDLRTIQHQTGKYVGSDHLPLIVDFSLEKMYRM